MRVQWDPMGEVMKVRWKAIGGEENFRMFVMK